MKYILSIIVLAVFLHAEEINTEIDITVIDSMKVEFVSAKVFNKARVDFWQGETQDQIRFIKSISKFYNKDSLWTDSVLQKLYDTVKYEKDYLYDNINSVEINDRPYLMGYLRKLQNSLRLIQISM